MKIEESSLHASRWYNFTWAIMGALSNKALLSILLIYQTSESRLFFPKGEGLAWVFWLITGLGYVSRIFYPLLLSKLGQGNRIKENQIYNLIGTLSVLVYIFLPSFNVWGWYSTFIALSVIAVQNICSSCDYPYVFISTINSFPKDQRIVVGIINSLPLPFIIILLLQGSERCDLRQLSFIIFILGIACLLFKQFYLMSRINIDESINQKNLAVSELRHLMKFKAEIVSIIIPFLAFSYGFEQMSYKWWLEVMNREAILSSIQAKASLTICLSIATGLKVYLLVFHRKISVGSKNLLRNISWYALLSLPMLYLFSIWHLPLLGLIINIPVSIILKGNVFNYFRDRVSKDFSNTDLSSVFNLVTAVLQPVLYALSPLITYNIPSIYPPLGPVGNSMAYCVVICICGIISNRGVQEDDYNSRAHS
jgi:hypothetical protein